MNEHERDRIAAAMHQLRPDWPIKQLRTLLDGPNLVDRPRRDVTVALAWVACEASSASPYRVLEAGPWWRAAGIEGATSNRVEWADDVHRCRVCSLPADRCRQLWAPDHDFEPAIKREVPGGVKGVVDELRDIKANAVPTSRPAPSEPKATGRLRAAYEAARTSDTERDAAPREALAGAGEA